MLWLRRQRRGHFFTRSRAFSGEVDTGSPQKMRPSKEIERFHDSTQHESALAFFVRAFGRKTGFHFS
jgi:hypothetical protein